MAVIGIDLGTTNSLAAIWRNDKCELIPNQFGEYLTPSVVSINDNDEILVGKIAKERLISHPDRTVSSFKRFMGTKKEYYIGAHIFSPEDLSSLVIRQLKADAETYLEEPVTEAVISVPAYFNDNQRTATKLAGKLAGLYVERIINEPSAAALASRNGLEQDKTFLIFDLGGGTLDVSIVETFENIIEIIAIAGDNHLGGDDFNAAIAERFYQLHPELDGVLSAQEQGTVLRLAEQCKIALTTQSNAGMIMEHNGKQYEMLLNGNQLIQCCAPIFIRMEHVIKRALKDSGKSISEIDEIVLVGGSSKMPTVQKYIEHLTGRETISRVSPDLAVAIGAGIVSGIKSRDEAVKDLVLTDICPFSLGVDAYNCISRKCEFSPIIERNTSLPVSDTQIYRTVRNNQRIIETSIYQGDSLNLKDDLFLGKCTIKIPPAPAGQIQIAVRFSYDINGILDVEVTVLQTGEKTQKLIVNNNTLTKEEIDQHLAKLKRLNVNAEGQDENSLLLARGERLFAENSGEIREKTAMLMDAFQASLVRNDIIEIEKLKRILSDFFDDIEKGNFGLNEDGLC